MSDELREVYAKAGLPDRYFDVTTPCDLYRGQTAKDNAANYLPMYPNLGFTRDNGTVRIADVRIDMRNGKKVVLGCRTVSGDYRGVSTFDARAPIRGLRWFRLPAGTRIPEALAITQDSSFKDKPNHYTVAPKDDMPYELFLVWLRQLNDQLVDLN